MVWLLFAAIPPRFFFSILRTSLFRFFRAFGFLRFEGDELFKFLLVDLRSVLRNLNNQLAEIPSFEQTNKGLRSIFQAIDNVFLELDLTVGQP